MAKNTGKVREFCQYGRVRTLFKCMLVFQEMEDALRTFASKPEHKKADSTVVAILSRGVEGAVCGTDSTSTCREMKRIFFLCEANI